MNFGFPILTLFIIFIIVLAIRQNQVSKGIEDRKDRFWRRELEANSSVRRDVDINALPYIKVPVSTFPKSLADDAEGQKFLSELKDLSEKRMLNLSGKSNTDLKLEYGRNHLDEMQTVADNFERLTIILAAMGEYLINRGRYQDALIVLEYGKSIGTDISKNYMLLGDCYSALHRPRQIESLKEQVKSMHLLMEHAILSHLEALPQTEEAELESFTTEKGDEETDATGASSHTGSEEGLLP